MEHVRTTTTEATQERRRREAPSKALVFLRMHIPDISGQRILPGRKHGQRGQVEVFAVSQVNALQRGETAKDGQVSEVAPGK